MAFLCELRARGQQRVLSDRPRPDAPEKHWRSISKEPRQTSAQTPSSATVPSRSQISRSNRAARYEAIQALHQQALSKREIARRLKLSRNTVRRFLAAESFPERSRRSYQGSILDPYKLSILDRWKAGCWNGTQLLEEVKKCGYSGSDSLFRLFMTSLRKHHQAAGTSVHIELSVDGANVRSSADLASKPPLKRRISPSRASWLYVSQSLKLDESKERWSNKSVGVTGISTLPMV